MKRDDERAVIPDPASYLRPGRFGGGGWRAGLDSWDAFGIGIGCLSLLLSCLIETRRDPYFWYDEVATLSLIRDPSFGHMLGAIAHGAENNPPLYTTLLRGWAHLGGTSALPVRLLSALFFCGALALVWRTLRWVYSAREVALGVAVGFFGVQALFEQVAQARFYGLFVFVTAAACAVAAKTTSSAVTRRREILATLIVHTLLVYTHMFGLLFSGAILTAMVVVDVKRKRLRPALYAAVVGAWVLWGIYAPFLLGGALLMKGSRSWLERPQRDDFIRLVARQTTWLPLIIAFLALVDFARRPGPGDTEAERSTEGRHGERAAIIAIGLAIIGVVPLVFIISRIATPAFLDRYLLPSVLGWVFITTHVAHASLRGLPSRAEPRWMTAACAVMFAGLALYPVAFAVAKPPRSSPSISIPDSLAALPIVVESGHDFWPLHYYAGSASDRYRFLLDSEVTLDPANFAGGGQEYHLMELYAREGYLGHSVSQREAFACTTPRFLVLDRPEFTLFERRFTPQAGFQSAVVGSYDGAPIRLVERQDRAPTNANCRVSELWHLPH